MAAICGVPDKELQSTLSSISNSRLRLPLVFDDA